MSMSSIAVANPCSNQYKESDKTDLPGKIDRSLSCQFTWKNSSGLIEGLESIYIKGKCKRFEDAQSSSCILTRHCPAVKEEFPESGTPIFINNFFLNSICETNKANEYYPVLNLSEDKSKKSIQAYVHCRFKKAKAIVLVNGLGKSKTCKIPAL